MSLLCVSMLLCEGGCGRLLSYIHTTIGNLYSSQRKEVFSQNTSRPSSFYFPREILDTWQLSIIDGPAHKGILTKVSIFQQQELFKMCQASGMFLLIMEITRLLNIVQKFRREGGRECIWLENLPLSKHVCKRGVCLPVKVLAKSSFFTTLQKLGAKKKELVKNQKKTSTFPSMSAKVDFTVCKHVHKTRCLLSLPLCSWIEHFGMSAKLLWAFNCFPLTQIFVWHLQSYFCTNCALDGLQLLRDFRQSVRLFLIFVFCHGIPINQCRTHTCHKHSAFWAIVGQQNV